MKFELMLQNGNKAYIPVVPNGVTWTTDRKGPGKLNFKVIKDAILDFREGNPARLIVNGQGVFYGFVFTKKRDKKQHIEVTAFDQIRYLLNKDTYDYKNMTAADVISMIAADFNLNMGNIEQTEFMIANRNEQDQTLLDIIYNALDLELTNKKKMYIFYDDFGKLTLKSLDNMKVDVLIDEESGENFDYTTSIDDQTYNKIKLTYENEESGKRDVYIAQDGSTINAWGVLQFFDNLNEGENGAAKADALLSLYNAKTRRLKITKAFGDVRVRAGCMVAVKLALGDINVQNYMLVEHCVHTFNESEHWMDLTLRGGEFLG